MEREFLEKICRRYGLGSPESEPLPLTGGLLHKMYALSTERGKYAVKLLNPYVMRRDTAQENYRVAEGLERILEKHFVPILPALVLDGEKMQKLEDRFFYLFDWYDGKALRAEEIEEYHCARAGELLAGIHRIEKRDMACRRKELHIDWDFYRDKLAENNEELYRLIAENRELLYEVQTRGNLALKKLPRQTAICHNDMDSKNVLWNGADCRIIDLECLSFSNPSMELYETALSWSGFETGEVNDRLFGAVIRSYLAAGGEISVDWEVLYDGSCARLEWLEYNLKRALGIECSDEETALGISEARNTIAHIVSYRDDREKILGCLRGLDADERQKCFV